MKDCIFCKIVAGDIPATKIYEDEEVLAILDISQSTKGHTLLLPKLHARNLLDMDERSAGRLFAQVPKIGNHLVKALGAQGMNILLNNEEIAGQTVFHTHVHLIPRYLEDGGPDFSDLTQHEYDLNQIAQEIGEVN